MGKHTCDAEWATKKKVYRLKDTEDAIENVFDHLGMRNSWVRSQIGKTFEINGFLEKDRLHIHRPSNLSPEKKNQSLQLFKYKKMNFCSRNAIFNWYTLGCKIIACVSQHARLCSLRNKHVRPNFIIRILMIHSNARHCFVVANSKWHYFIHWHFFGSKRSRIEKPFDFAFRVWTTINCLINWNIIYLYLLFFVKKTNLKLKKMIFVLSFNQK